MSAIEERLSELGLQLPEVKARSGDSPLVPAVIDGSRIYVSGHGPQPRPDGTSWKGQLGRDYSVEEGYEAAKSTGLSLLATLKGSLGSLDRVERIIKLLIMVNSTPDFTSQPQVAHGCSDLLVQLWGEKGRHARSAVGMAQLPGGIPVEIELIAKIKAD